MDTGSPRWAIWALEIIVQVLSWLGPVASKYIETLVIRHGPDHDVFEVKDFKASLDVMDARGRRSVYAKRERIRFTRDATSFYDYGWGEGEPFASHRVRPGRIAERRKIGSRYRSLVVFPEPQHAGDEMTFAVRRLMKNAVTGQDGWLEYEVYYKTRAANLRVTVPGTRRVAAARVVDARRGSATPVTVRRLADGRQRFQWSTQHPDVGDRYTLQWDW